KALAGERWLGGAKKYCAMIMLDVKNAFNTATWASILSGMTKIGIPEYLKAVIGSYFRDRVLWYDTEDGPNSYKVTAGVP
ncbi:hypothetical protein KR018_006410, partial [Drosophila ironensis]